MSLTLQVVADSGKVEDEDALRRGSMYFGAEGESAGSADGHEGDAEGFFSTEETDSPAPDAGAEAEEAAVNHTEVEVKQYHEALAEDIAEAEKEEPGEQQDEAEEGTSDASVDSSDPALWGDADAAADAEGASEAQANAAAEEIANDAATRVFLESDESDGDGAATAAAAPRRRPPLPRSL